MIVSPTRLSVEGKHPATNFLIDRKDWDIIETDT